MVINLQVGDVISINGSEFIFVDYDIVYNNFKYETPYKCYVPPEAYLHIVATPICNATYPAESHPCDPPNKKC
jgi:hypothetical protein